MDQKPGEVQDSTGSRVALEQRAHGASGGGMTHRLFLCVVAAVLGSSFQFGYNNSVLNTTNAPIKDWINSTVESRGSTGGEWIFPLTVSIWALGGLMGGLSAGIAADKLGRKGAMMWNNILALTAGILMGCAKVGGSFEMLIIGRFVSGLNCGFNTILPTMYLGEIAPVRLRGGLGVAHQLSVVCGILLSQVVGLPEIFGTSTFWPIAVAFTAFPALIQPALLLFCPESPRYLLINAGDERGAEVALSRLRQSLLIDDELAMIRQEFEAEKAAPKVDLKTLFTSPSLTTPLLLAVILHLSQQLCGINGIFYYSTDLFKKVNLSELQAIYCSIGSSGVLVVATLVSVPLMDLAGRRTLMLIGAGAIFLFEILLTILTQVSCGGKDDCGYVGVACVFLTVASFAIGPGSIPWFIPAELFPQGARANAMSFGGAVNWVANFVVGQTFPYLLSSMDTLAFLPFAGLLLLFWIFLFFKMPETKNKSFEEISAIFGGRGKTMAAPTPRGYEEM